MLPVLCTRQAKEKGDATHAARHARTRTASARSPVCMREQAALQCWPRCVICTYYTARAPARRRRAVLQTRPPVGAIRAGEMAMETEEQVRRPLARVAPPLTSPSQPFLLRAELRGHSEDVRAVVVAGGLGVATCSRDKTLRLWPFPGGPEAEAGARVFVGHTNFVAALAWAPPGALAIAPDGALVSGSRDGDVIVWHTGAASPLQRLSGHKLQVRAASLPRSLPHPPRSLPRRSPLSASPPPARSSPATSAARSGCGRTACARSWCQAPRQCCRSPRCPAAASSPPPATPTAPFPPSSPPTRCWAAATRARRRTRRRTRTRCAACACTRRARSSSPPRTTAQRACGAATARAAA